MEWQGDEWIECALYFCMAFCFVEMGGLEKLEKLLSHPAFLYFGGFSVFIFAI